MLITCPECELQVSDKAKSCPHCGYPMNSKKQTYVKKQKRLPNGFGNITKLNNQNLREPYRAMVTVGKNSKGRPICKLLKPKAYFKTYNEAYMALVEYNKDPYSLDKDMSVLEAYNEWTKEYFEKLKDNSKRTVKSAWCYCSELYDMRIMDVRAYHIKGCMDKCESPNIKSRIKSVFNLLFDYCVEHEIVTRNYARTFDVPDDVLNEIDRAKRGHLSFSDAEMSKLWENINRVPYVDVILYQCYSGWRPQELGLIKLENVDFDKNIIIGGMKTTAGFDRPVPIHPKVLDIVKAKYQEAKSLNSDYLFNCPESVRNMKLTYDKYNYRFENVLEELNINRDHRPHDPRKQFTTMAKNAKVDEYAIKYIIGHKIKDLTESTYTDRNIEWLCEEMCKI